MAYIPVSFVYVGITAAQTERPQLSWPRAGGDARRRMQANNEMLRSWCSSGMSAKVVQAHGREAMSQEVVPALKLVLQPTHIRALAPHLLAPAELEALHQTAGIMVEYALSYSFEDDYGGGAQGAQKPGFSRPGGLSTGLDGQPIVRTLPLLPPVDLLHSFSLYGTPAGRPAPGAAAGALGMCMGRTDTVTTASASGGGGMGEGVSRMHKGPAIALSVAARWDSTDAPVAATTAGVEGQGLAVVSGVGAAYKPDKKRLELGKAGAGAEAAAVRAPTRPSGKPGSNKPVAVNWLTNLKKVAEAKRKIAIQGGGGADGGPGKAKEGHKVLYRFNEGYTNAVKKPMLTSDFL
eukprot:gene6626-3282_t